MIVMRDIVKIYKNGLLELKALDQVSLTVSKGEFVAITGTSGSGKSTLMHIMGCLDRPNAGEYFLDGEDVLACPEQKLAAVRNCKIGFVFQKFNLLPKLDAQTNVEIPLIYRGEDRSVSRERAARLLEMVGLGDRLRHRPNELSGGQQQRVAIARALIGDPPLILADEPTGNLDSRSGAEIMELFKQLNNQGRTLVLITHDQDIARQANRIIYLQDGRVIPASGGTAAKREVS
ncbi:ABC transporter ATP-binding protein [Desulfoscipio geothermicus]|uniref:Putative ABC transport system ATP-binding protein n=1 Tax=Desulfoscipio geothermicus DSM 3669 TaxID=1121426 RepID=A0A1I6D267_9FIRM|nr:ABC transporter ATP-binding protein [Desulfoscipio geothermicus]SFQ99432.1 putative ABC transport system ATP-binding protein [Desulfoscipio geothermicus DSM 3669]